MQARERDGVDRRSGGVAGLAVRGDRANQNRNGGRGPAEALQGKRPIVKIFGAELAVSVGALKERCGLQP
ncbi:hypothetical protein ACE10Z_12800 [Bradyrhizobium sp. Pha-3]|uniref:hypothetical protein n=1 Tax=Bradyrhizobium sp. Pha-3 TaxID=208375 RepID=UPI0035D42712